MPKFETGHVKLGGRQKKTPNFVPPVLKTHTRAAKIEKKNQELAAGLEAIKEIAVKARIPVSPDGNVEQLAKHYAPIALASLAWVATHSPSHPARVSASVALLDRGYGRPNQAVQITGALAVRQLSDDELTGMAMRMAGAKFPVVQGEISDADAGLAGGLDDVATGGAGEVGPGPGGDGTAGENASNFPDVS